MDCFKGNTAGNDGSLPSKQYGVSCSTNPMTCTGSSNMIERPWSVLHSGINDIHKETYNMRHMHV